MGFIFFHKPDEENGYLSNWYLSDFVVGGVLYTSMEQYMMASKARLFHDLRTLDKIMATSDVSRIKRLGREVSNFSPSVWDENKCRVVTVGLLEKFRQNNELKGRLLSTGDALLAECAVKDRIWGIGLSMHDSRRFNKVLWRGQNLLGKCLMEARGILKGGFKE